MRGVRLPHARDGPNRLIPGVQAANNKMRGSQSFVRFMLQGEERVVPRENHNLYFMCNRLPRAANAALMSGDSAAPVRRIDSTW